jgi:hypothetical protein
MPSIDHLLQATSKDSLLSLKAGASLGAHRLTLLYAFDRSHNFLPRPLGKPLLQAF